MLDYLTVPDCRHSGIIMPQKISIILVNGHSMTSLSAIIDPFQHVNSIMGREIFSFELVSLEKNQTLSSTGIKIDCGISTKQHLESISPSSKPDLIFICCGTEINAASHTILIKYLRRIRRHFIPIVGLGASSRALVDAGFILDGKCAVHWNSTASFAEQYCEIEVENTLFVKNGLVTSCPGELATFDLSASYISKICGREIANQVCSHFLSNNLRSGDALQFIAADIMMCDNVVFRKAFDIMHNNIEEPIKTREIATMVGVSTRQIERIFHNNGFLPPGKYYLNIRLEKARQLVEQTNMPLLEVAYACGFGSNSNFIKNYRQKYGGTPTVSRKKGPLIKC